MSNLKGFAFSTITLGGIAALLLSVSSPSCGCIEPSMEFGWELNMVTPPDYTNTADLTPALVEAAAIRKYVGRTLKEEPPPKAFRKGECERHGTAVVCRYEIASGPARSVGLLLRYSEDDSRRVTAVRVDRFTKWLWQSEPQINR